MTIRSGYQPACSSSSPQPWSQLSSPSTYSLPLSSTCCHGNFSIMVIGIVPWGSSFSIFMQSLSVYATQVHIYAHAPPPRHRAIYREITTPENDGNAEVEPISTADMTSPPHTQWSMSIYVSSDGVLQMHRLCICVCFLRSGETLIFTLRASPRCVVFMYVCVATVARYVCAKSAICAAPCQHIPTFVWWMSLRLCAYKCETTHASCCWYFLLCACLFSDMSICVYFKNRWA